MRRSTAPAQAKPVQTLGRLRPYAGFVDTAFPRVAVHPELAHLFRGHSKDSPMRQRQLIVDALCAAAGGCIYTGRPLVLVHAGLGVTVAQWDAFRAIIASTASERNFHDADRKEFIELFGKQFRPVVVEKP